VALLEERIWAWAGDEVDAIELAVDTPYLTYLNLALIRPQVKGREAHSVTIDITTLITSMRVKA
jgi:hypothetical protein